ncbi:MAG TPA: anthranilate synthase component I family protein [bacterium]|nr:anthranilate synthase component I family protein [bacterium]
MIMPRWNRLQTQHVRLDNTREPVGLFKALYSREDWVFLYESLESAEARGRYSFIGGRPLLILEAERETITMRSKGRIQRERGDPLNVLRELTRRKPGLPGVLPFSGGGLGILSWDAVRYMERIPDTNPDTFGMPDVRFMFPSEIMVFDHQMETVDIIQYTDEGDKGRFEQLVETVRHSEPCHEARDPSGFTAIEIQPHIEKGLFCDRVEKARAYIHAGDVFQVVLSQRFSFPLPADPLALYQRLRQTNPSPYMYFLRMNDLNILGSSPEILVTCRSGRAYTRPLAGTRPRGGTPEQDVCFEKELLKDAKERAEHVMLVDLARSDLGRVCVPGSVKTTDLMQVERYAKVMHMVSSVTGRMQNTRDALDLVRAVFPAGTVSGSPKIRAMEIIDELESERRGVYAGAIGYFGWNGDMDMCIAIRALIAKNGRGMIQAGAGIVADSDPETEYNETLSKAKALFDALRGRETAV